MSSFRLTSPGCIIALQQLTKALETTQECIEKWFNSEDSAPIVSDNALPGNRQLLAFIHAVFNHNCSPLAIDDAIEAAEELQFEVTRCREDAESAFQHLLYFYNMQCLGTLRGHESDESLASVSTRGSVRTLEPMASRITECPARSVEDDGELIDDSNDPIQGLQEEALRADLHPQPISAHVLSDYEGEDAIPEDDSSVRVGMSKNPAFTEIMMHRTRHQPIPSKSWRKIKCHLPQCWSKPRERQTQMTQVTLPPSITLPYSRLCLPTANIR